MNFVTAEELGKLVSELKKDNAKLKEWNTKYKKENKALKYWIDDLTELFPGKEDIMGEIERLQALEFINVLNTKYKYRN